MTPAPEPVLALAWVRRLAHVHYLAPAVFYAVFAAFTAATGPRGIGSQLVVLAGPILGILAAAEWGIERLARMAIPEWHTRTVLLFLFWAALAGAWGVRSVGRSSAGARFARLVCDPAPRSLAGLRHYGRAVLGGGKWVFGFSIAPGDLARLIEGGGYERIEPGKDLAALEDAIIGLDAGAYLRPDPVEVRLDAKGERWLVTGGDRTRAHVIYYYGHEPRAGRRGGSGAENAETAEEGGRR